MVTGGGAGMRHAGPRTPWCMGARAGRSWCSMPRRLASAVTAALMALLDGACAHAHPPHACLGAGPARAGSAMCARAACGRPHGGGRAAWFFTRAALAPPLAALTGHVSGGLGSGQLPSWSSTSVSPFARPFSSRLQDSSRTWPRCTCACTRHGVERAVALGCACTLRGGEERRGAPAWPRPPRPPRPIWRAVHPGCSTPAPPRPAGRWGTGHEAVPFLLNGPQALQRLVWAVAPAAAAAG